MALDENTAGVTAKAAKSKEERKQSVLDRTEIVLAILLGVAAILTAWSTFQSAQLGSAMTAAYSEGIRVSDAASQAFNDASANDIADQALFLEFAKASQAGEEETALYIEESLMSEELAAAVDWWFEQPESAGYATPFTEENPNWSTALYDDAEALEAEQKDSLGSDFDILAIIIALALFLFGVASLVRQQRIKVGLGAVGGVILLFSVIRLLQLGNPAGVTFSLLF